MLNTLKYMAIVAGLLISTHAIANHEIPEDDYKPYPGFSLYAIGTINNVVDLIIGPGPNGSMVECTAWTIKELAILVTLPKFEGKVLDMWCVHLDKAPARGQIMLNPSKNSRIS